MADTDLRLRLAHYFVTPNETVTVRVVCSHRRDVNNVVARNKTEQEEGTDNKLGPSRDWRRGGEYDYPPTVVERGGKPRHVLDYSLSLEDKVSICDALSGDVRHAFTRPES